MAQISREYVSDQTASIASGQTASGSVDVKGMAGGSFQLPAAFTGVAITVRGSHNGTSWTNIPVEGLEANPITVSQGNSYPIPGKAFEFPLIQLVSGTSEGAARTIAIYLHG